MAVTKTSFMKVSFDLELVDPKLGHREKWTSEKVGVVFPSLRETRILGISVL